MWGCRQRRGPRHAGPARLEVVRPGQVDRLAEARRWLREYEPPDMRNPRPAWVLACELEQQHAAARILDAELRACLARQEAGR